MCRVMSSEKALPEFRDRMRMMIRELEIKQTEFAKSLGISANYVYLLTSGRKKTISEPLARLIESTYGYSAKWILTGEGNKMAAPQSRENLKNKTINKIRSLPSQELKAVAAFIKSLEELEE